MSSEISGTASTGTRPRDSTTSPRRTFIVQDELRAEVEEAGLIVEGLYGVEGPGWTLPDIVERLADPRRRAELLQVARLLESEPWVLGMSAHLLAVARAPRQLQPAGT
jgi:hypothetical protein